MKPVIFLFAGLFLISVMAMSVSAQEEAKEEEQKTEEKKEEPKADEGVPALPEKPKSIEEAVKNAELILVGVVDYVGETPSGWGRPPYRPSGQYIRYEVVKFLKGHYSAAQITVIHELIQGTRLVSAQPGMNPDVFAIDKKVILLLDKSPISSKPITFYCADPNYGAAAWSEDEEKKISEMIGK